MISRWASKTHRVKTLTGGSNSLFRVDISEYNKMWSLPPLPISPKTSLLPPLPSPKQSYGMRQTDEATNIDGLVRACQPVVNGNWSDTDHVVDVIWMGWCYHTLITVEPGQRDIEFSVQSGDTDACDRCLALTVHRAQRGRQYPALITSNLEYVNFCFDGAKDRCFSPSIQHGRSNVIMRMVDLVNSICSVHYCTAQDVQRFGGRGTNLHFYPGSAHTMMKVGGLFYEPFGFISAPDHPSLSMADINNDLATHSDIKALFTAIMERTASAALVYISDVQKKRSRPSPVASELEYTVMFQSYASWQVKAGSWYMQPAMSVPVLAESDTTFDVDVMIFELAQMKASIDALSAIFRTQPVFIHTPGAEPITLLQCTDEIVQAREREFDEKRHSRLARWVDDHIARYPLTVIAGSSHADKPLAALFNNSHSDPLHDVLEKMLGSTTGIIKYYRCDNGDAVVKGDRRYLRSNSVDIQCLAIASASKRLKTSPPTS